MKIIRKCLKYLLISVLSGIIMICVLFGLLSEKAENDEYINSKYDIVEEAE